MGRVNRRIGKSSETANITADGTGGGILDAFIYDYFNRSGNISHDPGTATAPGHVATGGVISDYTDPGSGNIYRAHIFTSSGSLVINSLDSSLPSTVDVLCVGGGGGGGYQPTLAGSGGGGGGVHYRTGLPISATTYPITIGAGGASAQGGSSTSSPIIPVTAAGGGAGNAGSGENGSPGASGGGGGHPGASGGSATGASGHPGGIDITSPTRTKP